MVESRLISSTRAILTCIFWRVYIWTEWPGRRSSYASLANRIAVRSGIFGFQPIINQAGEAREKKEHTGGR